MSQIEIFKHFYLPYLKSIYDTLGYTSSTQFFEMTLGVLGFSVVFMTLLVMIYQSCIYHKQLIYSYRPQLVIIGKRFYIYWVEKRHNRKIINIPLWWIEKRIKGNTREINLLKKKQNIDGKEFWPSLPLSDEETNIELCNIGLGAARDIEINFIIDRKDVESGYKKSVESNCTLAGYFGERNNFFKIDCYSPVSGTISYDYYTPSPFISFDSEEYIQLVSPTSNPNDSGVNISLPPSYIHIINAIYHNMKCKNHYDDSLLPTLKVKISYRDIGNRRIEESFYIDANTTNSSLGSSEVIIDLKVRKKNKSYIKDYIKEWKAYLEVDRFVKELRRHKQINKHK